MPQYAFNIGGQRHIFEGPDAQTTAQYAQRWAAQEAGRTPVSVADIQRRLGSRPSQFATDIGARVNQDVADLTGTINDVKAHPSSLLNVPKVVGAVARYMPNAFGLVPAAGVDQVTGPVVRGLNSRFGTHWDPRYATDQILNAAGAMLGTPELSAPESILPRAAETSAPRGLLSGPTETSTERSLSGPSEVSAPRLTTHIGKQPLLTAPIARAKPNLTVAYEAPDLGDHVLGQNSQGENVVPLSDSFMESHNVRKGSLSDLPKRLQSKYINPIKDLIFKPVQDDPDYGGHSMGTIKDIENQLNNLAEAHRSRGGPNARIGDALADAAESLRTMVAEQQPEMAKELGYLPQDDPGPTWAARPPPTPAAAGSKPADVMRFERYVKPAEGGPRLPADVFDDIAKLNPEQRAWLLKQWTAMRDAGAEVPALPDDVTAFPGRTFVRPPPPPDAGEPLPDGVIAFPGRKVGRPPASDGGEPSEQTPEDLNSGIETAASDDASSGSEEDPGRNLPALWTPPGLPAVWNPPRTQLPVVWKPRPIQLPAVASRPANAFSGPPGLEWTVVPPAARATNGFDFNALRPPRWVPLAMVAAANQPQDSQQPQK